MFDFIYGSARFKSDSGIVAGNRNDALIADIPLPRKLSIRDRSHPEFKPKDALLFLPSDASDFVRRNIVYPTHQGAWAPLWFTVTQHAAPLNPRAVQYQETVSTLVTPEQRRAFVGNLTDIADAWMAEFNSGESGSDPKKHYKKLTRIVQDALLYHSTLGRGRPVANHTTHMNSSDLASLVGDCNALRRDDGRVSPTAVAAAVHAALARFPRSPDDRLPLHHDYELLLYPRQKMPGAVDISAIVHADVLGRLFDVEIARDGHDWDAVTFSCLIEQPLLIQYDLEWGHTVSEKSRPVRLDLSVVPSGADPFACDGDDSFQSDAMKMLAHGTPQTFVGRSEIQRARDVISSADLAGYYLFLADAFLSKATLSKSFPAKMNDVVSRPMKRVLPLYRVCLDLLPRAWWMLERRTHGGGVAHADLIDTFVGAFPAIASTVADIFNAYDKDLAPPESRLHEMAANLVAVTSRMQAVDSGWRSKAEQMLQRLLNVNPTSRILRQIAL
ncbi:MAG: hypothetical protein QOI24_1210 [Acidobacteriota bacterium]|jgi:hypothetical protein|nr:hypothetical protein [Acidobacteriota bacterium]